MKKNGAEGPSGRRGDGEPSPKGESLCDRRGYCGPFVKQEQYDAYPDPMWHGYGDCTVCQSTRLVASEEEKRKQAMEIAELPVPKS